jgi:hypothetical protein
MYPGAEIPGKKIGLRSNSSFELVQKSKGELL